MVSLNRPLPIRPATQLVVRSINRQDKSHRMNPGNPAKSPNLVEPLAATYGKVVCYNLPKSAPQIKMGSNHL